jgi:hypothetical protein
VFNFTSYLIIGEWGTEHKNVISSLQFFVTLLRYVTVLVDQDSVVSLATRDGLDSSGIASRWGARFSSPVQQAQGPIQRFRVIPGGTAAEVWR